MTYLSQAYIYLIIFGDNFAPNELTKQLNIGPTEWGLKGEKHRTGAILKECFWKYQSKKVNNATEELDECMQDLVNIFRDKVDLLKSIMHENNLKSKCFIVIEARNNEDTGAVLDPQFIEFLHKLTSPIEIDIYSL